jgi:hypothetical protein
MFGASFSRTPAAALLLLTLVPAAACAAGALAIGQTEDLAKDGYSIGIAVNAASDTVAQRAALAWCRNNGSPQTRAQCKVIEAFRNRCVAEANDPAPGTPGAGWAVGDDKKAAEEKAMEMCLATAGESRRLFCKVAQLLCDGP